MLRGSKIHGILKKPQNLETYKASQIALLKKHAMKRTVAGVQQEHGNCLLNVRSSTMQATALLLITLKNPNRYRVYIPVYLSVAKPASNHTEIHIYPSLNGGGYAAEELY